MTLLQKSERLIIPKYHFLLIVHKEDYINKPQKRISNKEKKLYTTISEVTLNINNKLATTIINLLAAAFEAAPPIYKYK